MEDKGQNVPGQENSNGSDPLEMFDVSLTKFPLGEDPRVMSWRDIEWHDRGIAKGPSQDFNESPSEIFGAGSFDDPARWVEKEPVSSEPHGCDEPQGERPSEMQVTQNVTIFSSKQSHSRGTTR